MVKEEVSIFYRPILALGGPHVNRIVAERCQFASVEPADTDGMAAKTFCLFDCSKDVRGVAACGDGDQDVFLLEQVLDLPREDAFHTSVVHHGGQQCDIFRKRDGLDDRSVVDVAAMREVGCEVRGGRGAAAVADNIHRSTLFPFSDDQFRNIFDDLKIKVRQQVQ